MSGRWNVRLTCELSASNVIAQHFESQSYL
jgi:hypothetical protein